MTATMPVATEKYAHCISASKRVRWEIDEDIIRGRKFHLKQKFLPDSISGVNRLEFLEEPEARLLSQIQGRTYANMFGLVERFINCKVLELSRHHWTGDQVALEALVRFSDEELKHQELFRRIELMMGDAMPPGYRFLPQPNEVASVVLEKSTWAVMGLTLLIELFTLSHYLKSIQPDQDCSPLYKDVFLFHWKEESQHAILDELEWVREDVRLTPEERDRAVDDMIALVGAVDGILQAQCDADVAYFLEASGQSFYEEYVSRIRAEVLRAYRWQYIVSGVELERFQKVLGGLVNEEQMARIQVALAPILAGQTAPVATEV